MIPTEIYYVVFELKIFNKVIHIICNTEDENVNKYLKFK